MLPILLRCMGGENAGKGSREDIKSVMKKSPKAKTSL